MPNKNKNKAPTGIPSGMITRSNILFSPNTFRESDNSVEFTLATEQPAKVWDWNRFDVVTEVIVASGVRVPKNGQVPLVDSHDRSTVSSIFGSVRDIRVEGDSVVGRLYFSSAPAAQEALAKVREGHLDSGSVGYEQTDSEWINENESKIYNGRSFQGAMLLTKVWNLKEFSLVAIGADSEAKARAEALEPETETISREAAKQNCKENENMENENKIVEQPQQIDTEAIKREVTAEEVKRSAGITDLCTRHGMTERAGEFIRAGKTLSDVQEIILDTIEKTTKSVSTGTIEVGAEHEEKERAAIVDAALIQIVGRGKVKNPAPGAESIRGVSMTAIAASMLRRSGINTDLMSKDEIVTRALSMRSSPSVPNLGIGAFPSLLSNVAEKVLMTAYNYAPTTYQAWCKIGSLPDFKAAKRVRMSAAPDLLLTPEFAEVQYGQMSDTGEDIALGTYSRRLVLTRQAIINDDLDYFNTLFTAYGSRAAALINRLPYAVLAANGNLSDGDALFDGALHTANTAISTTSAGVAFQAFGQHKALSETGDENMYLNAMPRYLLVGYANWVAARILFESLGSTESDKNSAVINPFNGLQVIFDANITTNTGKQHYYVADPSMSPTVEVAFLNGRREPTVMMEDTSPVLGVAFTALIDATAKALQRQGIYRNQGG